MPNLVICSPKEKEDGKKTTRLYCLCPETSTPLLSSMLKTRYDQKTK